METNAAAAKAEASSGSAVSDGGAEESVSTQAAGTNAQHKQHKQHKQQQQQQSTEVAPAAVEAPKGTATATAPQQQEAAPASFEGMQLNPDAEEYVPSGASNANAAQANLMAPQFPQQQPQPQPFYPQQQQQQQYPVMFQGGMPPQQQLHAVQGPPTSFVPSPGMSAAPGFAPHTGQQYASFGMQPPHSMMAPAPPPQVMRSVASMPSPQQQQPQPQPQPQPQLFVGQPGALLGQPGARHIGPRPPLHPHAQGHPQQRGMRSPRHPHSWPGPR